MSTSRPANPDAWKTPARVAGLGAAIALALLAACASGCYNTATVIAAGDVAAKALDGADQVIDAQGKALSEAYAGARANVVTLAKAGVRRAIAAGKLDAALADEAFDLVAAKLEASFRAEQAWRDLAADAKRSNERGREAIGYARETATQAAALQERVDVLVDQVTSTLPAAATQAETETETATEENSE